MRPRQPRSRRSGPSWVGCRATSSPPRSTCAASRPTTRATPTRRCVRSTTASRSRRRSTSRAGKRTRCRSGSSTWPAAAAVATRSTTWSRPSTRSSRTKDAGLTAWAHTGLGYAYDVLRLFELCIPHYELAARLDDDVFELAESAGDRPAEPGRDLSALGPRTRAARRSVVRAGDPGAARLGGVLVAGGGAGDRRRREPGVLAAVGPAVARGGCHRRRIRPRRSPS